MRLHHPLTQEASYISFIMLSRNKRAEVFCFQCKIFRIFTITALFWYCIFLYSYCDLWPSSCFLLSHHAIRVPVKACGFYFFGLKWCAHMILQEKKKHHVIDFKCGLDQPQSKFSTSITLKGREEVKLRVKVDEKQKKDVVRSGCKDVSKEIRRCRMVSWSLESNQQVFWESQGKQEGEE